MRPPTNLKPQALHYEDYCLSAREWWCYAGLGITFAALCAYIFYRSFLVFLLFLPFGILYPIYEKKNLMQKRLQKLNMEFKEGILILASFLSAGYSIENAFAASAGELRLLYGEEGMIVKEFQLIQNQLKMNRPIEQLLAEFAERSGLDDVKNFSEVFVAAKRSGGELVSIINHTAGVIRDKVQVQEEIITLTSSKRFEQQIMNMIPFGIVIYIDLTSPGFFQIMYGTLAGRVVMSVCLGIYLVSYALAQSILKIEV